MPPAHRAWAGLRRPRANVPILRPERPGHRPARLRQTSSPRFEATVSAHRGGESLFLARGTFLFPPGATRRPRKGRGRLAAAAATPRAARWLQQPALTPDGRVHLRRHREQPACPREAGPSSRCPARKELSFHLRRPPRATIPSTWEPTAPGPSATPPRTARERGRRAAPRVPALLQVHPHLRAAGGGRRDHPPTTPAGGQTFRPTSCPRGRHHKRPPRSARDPRPHPRRTSAPAPHRSLTPWPSRTRPPVLPPTPGTSPRTPPRCGRPTSERARLPTPTLARRRSSPVDPAQPARMPGTL